MMGKINEFTTLQLLRCIVCNNGVALFFSGFVFPIAVF